MLGVAKAYVTRVGEGPFPSEIEGPAQARVRELGGEFGTITGRERRCGWLDLVALRFAVRVNGITSLALTKLDVLSAFDEIPVCVRYRLQTGARRRTSLRTSRTSTTARPSSRRSRLGRGARWPCCPRRGCGVRLVRVGGAYRPRRPRRHRCGARRGAPIRRSPRCASSSSAREVRASARLEALVLALADRVARRPGIRDRVDRHVPSIAPDDGEALLALATSLGIELVVIGRRRLGGRCR